MTEFLIIIQLDSESVRTEAQVKSFCEHYNCKAERKKGEYWITSNDPINFFWLGMNFNNHVLNKLMQAK
jgi:hypothetical protein